ncbi:MAG: hypothetical protein ACQEVA_15780 [Myxococcota bacterium]
MDEDEFRNFIDAAKPTVPSSIRTDLDALYRHFDLPASDHLSTSRVTDALPDRCKEALPSTDDYEGDSRELLSKPFFGKLRNHFLLRHWVDDQPLQPYYDVLDRLRTLPDEGVRLLPFDEAREEWRKSSPKPARQTIPRLIA